MYATEGPLVEDVNVSECSALSQERLNKEFSQYGRSQMAGQ